ncbi:heat shock protein [Luteococcus japonicus]|uniref:Protease HtpX homolog n=2 Tax=Luteococcus TaxID=33983 RepID=A0A3N1ZWW5_9ACTN|nr:zinc metalloprotease HtpX [Luteococcus japonicus]ROR54642.1 heat shock protein [Luteococcus japonicus]
MHNHFNGVKTAALFGGIFGLLLLVGGALASYTRNSSFIIMFALFGVLTTAWSYWNSDKIAIRSMGAQPVSPQEAPGLYRIVEELSSKANQPMPSLYVSPTMSPNAFATGRNPSHAAVCVTQGITQLLDERELRAVLGHELMHVYNRDILTSSVAAAIAGVISSIGQMLSFGAMFGGGRSDENRGSGIGVLVAALVAPLAASVIQMAISRTREFDADEDGSELTGDPLALANALAKIEHGVAAAPMAPTKDLVNSSHMMIANPFGGLNVRQMFSTHPATADRIMRLEQQAQRMGQ